MPDDDRKRGVTMTTEAGGAKTMASQAENAKKTLTNRLDTPPYVTDTRKEFAKRELFILRCNIARPVYVVI